MRATFSGLNTMVRGIMANQMSLDTTGHNITNAGTEGYSRQSAVLATTYSEQRSGLYGNVQVGTGVDALAVVRARNVYADIQYRNENPTQNYYKTMAVHYDKLETIFDDSKNLGIEEAINQFYRSWVDLSTTASNSPSRTQVIEHGRNLSEILQTTVSELQEQIRTQYEDIKSELIEIDDMLEELVSFNKQITMQESTGAMANDLRDSRDLLVDKLSNYMNINVTENEMGAYQINSGGVTLVNGPSRTHLVITDGVSSSFYGVDYGITDYHIKIKESNVNFIPQDGIIRARLDAIAEEKAYIDKMADIASFLLTAFNDQHKQGWDIDGHYKFVDSNGNDVTVESEATLTAVNYLKANGTAVSKEEEASITFRDGKYYLEDAEVKKLDPDIKYLTEDEKLITKVPDTINFYGEDGTSYQYRYDPDYGYRYLYKYDDDAATDPDNPNNKVGGELLSGVRIIEALEINARFNENRGDHYVAAATSKQYVESTDANGNIVGTWEDMAWNNRTGDGTNAVYLSELFNIHFDTLVGANKANSSLLQENCILRNKDGYAIDTDGNVITDPTKYINETSLTKLSINSFYQKSMSTLGVDAYSTDVNYEAMQAIMTQVENWRDSTAGVDWNEELTNMIKFQKGFASCSRCLNAMDEMLDRLVNSTGVVGR